VDIAADIGRYQAEWRQSPIGHRMWSRMFPWANDRRTVTAVEIQAPDHSAVRQGHLDVAASLQEATEDLLAIPIAECRRDVTAAHICIASNQGKRLHPAAEIAVLRVGVCRVWKNQPIRSYPRPRCRHGHA